MRKRIHEDDHIVIWEEDDSYLLESHLAGMTMERFSLLLKDQFPQISVTAFLALRRVLTTVPSGPEVFGTRRERIQVRLAEGKMQAWMTLAVTAEELLLENRARLTSLIDEVLRDHGVRYGILADVIEGELENGVEYRIAEGTPPSHGKDAVVQMLQLLPPTPEVLDDGHANHYELNLIQRVEKGDWLGERTEPTSGVPGADVMGQEVSAKPGTPIPLHYERSSVTEEVTPGKTILRASKPGAVFYRGDMIGVYNALELPGNVDFSTGNIDFDGYVTVKGIVDDHFSVLADRDIEVMGEYGVGGADTIVSRGGSIYIRGGIAGKGRAVIKCHKDLYVKFLSDVTVECEGNVYIGFYAINANIRARQVVVDSPRGRIVGGKVHADYRIEVAEAGNWNETRTFLRVEGFRRQALIIELERVVRLMEKGRAEMSRLKQKLRVASDSENPAQKQAQHALHEELDLLRDHLKDVEYAYKSLADQLRTPGEGAIVVKKKAFPRVRMEMGERAEELMDEHPMCTFVYRDGEIAEE